MCGIIGTINFSKTEAQSIIEEGMKKIQHRGKDAQGTKNYEQICFGHLLHAIENNIKQPIENEKAIMVANCEIYNWKELSKKEKINAKNDAELLFYLLQKKIEQKEKITKILNELDGDFAFAYFDKVNKKVIIARDKIGMKPMVIYQEKNKLIFASEKKAIPKKYQQNSTLLNPRKIIEIQIKQNKLIYKETKQKIQNNNIIQDIIKLFKTNEKKEKEEKKEIELIENIIEEAIIKRTKGKQVGLLLSGGIDSTLIGTILKKNKIEFNCYFATVKNNELLPGKDLEYSKKAAKLLGKKLNIYYITMEEIENMLPKIKKIIESDDVVQIGVATVLYFATKKIKEKIVLMGTGSDELFMGYSRFRENKIMKSYCWKRIQELYWHDLYYQDIITMYNNTELRAPYLDKEVIEMGLKLPTKLKISKTENKKIIRNLAKKNGLPEEFYNRKKCAAQYGSKMNKAIQKISRKKGYKKRKNYLKILN